MAVTAQNVTVGIVGGSDLVKITEQLGEGSEFQSGLHTSPNPLHKSSRYHFASWREYFGCT